MPAIEGVAEMGLPITNQVRCSGINEQVAQKLHACTGPQRQDRARDILDILVVDMLGQLDRVRARAAAERTFAERKTHAFPPETIIPPEWNVELETLASELGYRTTKAAEIQKRIYEFSCRNCQRLKPPNWSLPIGTRPINPPASRRCCNREQSLLRGSTSVMVENGRTFIKTPRMP